MIDDIKYVEVLVLGNFLGWSQREISKRSKISRGTIQNILSGKTGPKYRILDSKPNPEKMWRFDASETEKEVKRCPKCGFLVKMPCLACYVRETTARNRS